MIQYWRIVCTYGNCTSLSCHQLLQLNEKCWCDFEISVLHLLLYMLDVNDGCLQTTGHSKLREAKSLEGESIYCHRITCLACTITFVTYYVTIIENSSYFHLWHWLYSTRNTHTCIQYLWNSSSALHHSDHHSEDYLLAPNSLRFYPYNSI